MFDMNKQREESRLKSATSSSLSFCTSSPATSSSSSRNCASFCQGSNSRETNSRQCWPTRTTAHQSANNIRQSRNLSYVKQSCVLFYILLTVIFGHVRAATFFYGATRNDMSPSADSASSFASIEEAAKLTREQLKNVYDFCQFLPYLVNSRRIPKNRQSIEICRSLLSLLKPMFDKKEPPSNCDPTNVNCKRHKRSNQSKSRRRFSRRRHAGH